MEDYSTLTGDELRAAIAEKVFGWHPRDANRWQYYDESRESVNGGPLVVKAKPWASDIAAAFEVVERIDGCLHLRQHGTEGRWEACFCESPTEAVGHGDTPAEAICRAALFAADSLVGVAP